MSDTKIQFHTDGFTHHRPAIDVKLNRAIRTGGRQHLDEVRNRFEGIFGEDETESLFEIAEEIVRGRFWGEDLPRMATVLGFEVESAGRSGGWVEITNGDPIHSATASDAEKRDWINRYQQLRDFCDREVAEAFNRISDVAENLAIQSQFSKTVTARSAAAFDGDPRAAIEVLAVSMGFAPTVDRWLP